MPRRESPFASRNERIRPAFPTRGTTAIAALARYNNADRGTFTLKIVQYAPLFSLPNQMSDPHIAESESVEKPSDTPMQIGPPGRLTPGRITHGRLTHATYSLAAITILAVGWMAFTEWQELAQEANGLTGAPFVVDLNLATESELHLLPGVGPKLAQQILKLRDERGGFERIEDLLEVPGIKKTRLEQIRPYISLSSTDRAK